ncbi:MAG TPA: hypothetical protein VIU83_06020, partial [Candidatus Deferrimicrobium sp.]
DHDKCGRDEQPRRVAVVHTDILLAEGDGAGGVRAKGMPWARVPDRKEIPADERRTGNNYVELFTIKSKSAHI